MTSIEASRERPRVGLALSGGAALGAAHIGVIDVLSEAQVPLDVIAGTSIGAIVGAAHGAGKLEVLRRLALDANTWKLARLFDARLPGVGLLRGDRVSELLRQHFGDTLIEELTPRFGAVATDLVSGREHVVREGPLVEALRASMSIPGLFEPVVTGAAVLVDGQLVQPLPVPACRALGAEIIIAVDLFGDQRGVTDAGGIAPGAAFEAGMIDILSASFVVLTAALTRAQLGPAPDQIVIVPRIGDIAPHRFQRAGELIERGAEAARAALPAILAAVAAGTTAVGNADANEPRS